eukprot:CAMPEP_0195585502 /NCGR_PEP_ID=MMETSP0814-20130614/27627_1 /TAXON_ID=97485 /ORGANISM="Prymnesium parvum, Strain Texoma1" /LENGTH=46 /DNA_ID= /DNA_START= /DNA_END= /DNA_ORIENTATION=
MGLDGAPSSEREMMSLGTGSHGKHPAPSGAVMQSRAMHAASGGFKA